MDTATVVGLLGEEYLSMGDSWLYSDAPAGHDIELRFRFGALASAKVKTKSADGNTTVLMTMDRGRVEAAPPYQAFVDREIQRRTRRSVERIVILHAGDDPSQGELQTLVNYAESTLAIDTTGVPVRVKAYRIPPENITRSFA